jgi:hypothetical protein
MGHGGFAQPKSTIFVRCYDSQREAEKRKHHGVTPGGSPPAGEHRTEGDDPDAASPRRTEE